MDLADCTMLWSVKDLLFKELAVDPPLEGDFSHSLQLGVELLYEGCSAHSMNAGEIARTVKNAIASHIASILDLSDTLAYIAKLPESNRLMLTFEAQIAKLEGEMEHLHRMKLRIYEDLTVGVIDKDEYADFRRQYTDMLGEKSDALERVRREQKNAMVYGDTEKVWVTMFRQYETIEEVDRRALMALVDKILVHEGHALEVVFRYRDEYSRMSEFVETHAKLLGKSTEYAAKHTAGEV